MQKTTITDPKVAVIKVYVILKRNKQWNEADTYKIGSGTAVFGRDLHLYHNGIMQLRQGEILG